MQVPLQVSFRGMAASEALEADIRERLDKLERFSDEMRWYRYRLRTKPGLTGLAQAMGLRGNSSLETRVDRDNWYIENWSLGLDLQIMLRTFGAVLRGENAE